MTINRKISVKNNHNVYILGAGFSVDYGMPTQSNFIITMKLALEYFAKIKDHKKVEAIENVLSFRLKASSAAYRINLNLDNIEDLFSLASFESTKLNESICKAISATLEYSFITRSEKNMDVTFYEDNIPGRIALKYKSNPHKPNSYLIPYYDLFLGALTGKWCDLPETQNGTIITFNYDTVVENSLNNIGFEYSYGFTNETKFNLLKLHGSTNWEIKNNKIIPDYGNNFVSDPFIIPPTWNKSISKQMNSLWLKAITSIETATRIYIIGFSIPETDQYFKYLMAAGLQNNISLINIYLVNPDNSEILKGRIWKLISPYSKQYGLLNTEYSTLFDLIKSSKNGLNRDLRGINYFQT